MPTDVTIATSTLFAFLLVLSRMAGVFTFLPLPGSQDAPAASRIVCAVCFTLVLFPAWPKGPLLLPSLGTTIGWVTAELALGVALGLAVLLVSEAFNLAAQIISLQAGYSYASTIDPTSQTDAGLLPLIWQLMAGLLLFSTGLHRYILKALGQSLTTCPPGSCLPSITSAELLIAFGQQMMSLGLRLAMPLVVLLMVVDILLSLVTRVSAQLQLLSLSFPVKLLGALLLFSMLCAVMPTLYSTAAEQLMPVLAKLLR